MCMGVTKTQRQCAADLHHAEPSLKGDQSWIRAGSRSGSAQLSVVDLIVYLTVVDGDDAGLVKRLYQRLEMRAVRRADLVSF